MASAGMVMLIVGLIFLFISAILFWIGIDTRNRELKAGNSPNAGWWWIFIGTIMFFFGLISLLLAFFIPKPNKPTIKKASSGYIENLKNID